MQPMPMGTNLEGPPMQPDPMQMQKIMQMKAMQEGQGGMQDPRARMMAYRQAMMGQQGMM
jgi:hypothetical protein